MTSRPLSTVISAIVVVLYCIFMLVSCQPVPGQLPPQWAITDTLVNANSPGFNQGEARTIVFFSKIPWQSSYPRQANFASGWRNDVLVSNPYSFQVIVSGGNFLNGGLILRDVATGQEIQVPITVNLRKALRQYLQKHPHVESVTEPPSNEGGGGATLVELRV